MEHRLHQQGKIGTVNRLLDNWQLQINVDYYTHQR
jgi:hypothetical protein